MGQVVLQKKVIANKTEWQAEGNGTNSKRDDTTKSGQYLGAALPHKSQAFQMVVR